MLHCSSTSRPRTRIRRKSSSRAVARRSAADLNGLRERAGSGPTLRPGHDPDLAADERDAAGGAGTRRRGLRRGRRRPARPARPRSSRRPSPERGAACYVGGKTALNADYFSAVTNPTPYVLDVRARAQLPRADDRLPLAGGGARLDRAQPALGRRRLRPADARLPARRRSEPLRLPARQRRSTPGCRCSCSRCCSGSRWTTRSS